MYMLFTSVAAATQSLTYISKQKHKYTDTQHIQLQCYVIDVCAHVGNIILVSAMKTVKIISFNMYL